MFEPGTWSWNTNECNTKATYILQPYFTYNNIYSTYHNNNSNNNNNNNNNKTIKINKKTFLVFLLVIKGILVFFQEWGILVIFRFWECFRCYNLLINNNIINTSNYVNIF